MIFPHLKFSYFSGKNVHIGVSGSIAAYKALDLCRDFIHTDIKVSVTLTLAAQEFLKPLSFSALGADPVYTDMFSPKNTPFAHLEPAHFSDVFLIAPATANTIAKLAHGFANDLLSCQALAFQKKIIIAPAMNPGLWRARPTQENVAVLKERGVEIILPKTGKVACGDEGEGKLAPIEDIYFYTLKALSPQDMKNKNVLVTLGPTREFWDPVRFISNGSSGKMGSAVAVAAWLRGAKVVCVKGPCDVWLPSDIEVCEVVSASQMYEKCIELWRWCDIGCMCAAVSDFSPSQKSSKKIKKGDLSSISLVLEKTPDILLNLGKRKRDEQILIGFAAETEDNFIELAKEKLEKKNLDYIVANKVNMAGAGFETDTNSVTVIDKEGHYSTFPIDTKANIALKIWDLVLQK